MNHRLRIITVGATTSFTIAALAGCGGGAPGPSASPSGQRTATAADRAAAGAAAEKALGDGRIEDGVRLAAFAAAAGDAMSLELYGRALLAKAAMLDARHQDASAVRASAADQYRRAADLDAANAGLQHATAMVLDGAGDAAAARSHYDRAVTAAPKRSEFILHRGNARLRSGDRDGAANDARVLAELAPDDAWTHAFAAEVDLARNEPLAAAIKATKATTLAPDNVAFRVIRARSLRESGRATDAVELLSALPVADRSAGFVAEELARGWTALERHEKAADTWQRLHATQPNDLRSAIEAARSRLKSGDRLAARSLIDEAKRIAPDAPEIAELERTLIEASDRRPDASSHQ